MFCNIIAAKNKRQPRKAQKEEATECNGIIHRRDAEFAETTFSEIDQWLAMTTNLLRLQQTLKQSRQRFSLRPLRLRGFVLQESPG
jgi:hypothetical protein